MGSFIENYANQVEIITRAQAAAWEGGASLFLWEGPQRRFGGGIPVPQQGGQQQRSSSKEYMKPKCTPYPLLAVDKERGAFAGAPALTFQHPYPPTRLQFVPDTDPATPDLLASAGDFLRIWRVSDEGVVLEKLLNNVRGGFRG